MTDITLLCPEQFEVEKMLDNNILIDHFLFVEDDGHLSIEESFIQRSENVDLLFQFVLGSANEFSKIYSDRDLIIYDLTKAKNSIISFRALEANYQDWIETSGHENNMDEYGMLLGVVSFIIRNQKQKNLLAVARKR